MLALLDGICVSPPVPHPLLYSSSIISIYEFLPLLVMRLTRHFSDVWPAGRCFIPPRQGTATVPSLILGVVDHPR